MFRIANVCKLFVIAKEMTNKTWFCSFFQMEGDFGSMEKEIISISTHRTRDR